MDIRLVKIKEIKGKIILKTGLHIGAGESEMHIGGTDNPVIKHPLTQEPYIPGSSLKGKVRSLLELESGLMGVTGGKPLQASDLRKLSAENKKAACKRILKIFGSGGADADIIVDEEIGPTRVSFSDCPLNEVWKKGIEDKRLPFVEVKSENSINRISSVAENPRFTERVVAGAQFDFQITLKIMGDEEENELFPYLLRGLKLLEKDALGGSGSRGYGKIEFEFADAEIKKAYDAITLS
ncbi:MAG: type III-A CRISPR-associated RAMP protein Csm3 [Syntrophales bacterium]|nr:type III-A CRISPR-associated RAMP protein Csm3 [Syntrophales bacterium]